MISENVRAGSGFVGDGRTIAAVAAQDDRRNQRNESKQRRFIGQTTTTTPVGSGMVKLKCELATGFTVLKI